MNNLDSIIKKNIKNLILEVENPRSFYDIKRTPDGTTILLINGSKINEYNENDKRKQIERLTDIEFEDLFKDPNYKNYKNSNNDVYAKSCNDQFSINAFSAFNTNYLESYIQVLNDDSKIPQVFKDEDENIKYWWVSKKLKEKYGNDLKPKHYIGTDYYFLKFKEFFINYNKATNNTNVYKVEKGLTKKLNNFTTGEIIKEVISDVSVERPSFLIPNEDVIILPDGRKINSSNVIGGWMDWSITKNSWCEITGSLLQYKQTKIQTINSYYTPHVRNFEINFDKFKNSLPINPVFEKKWNDQNGIIKFYPCFSRQSLNDGSLFESFNGYYDEIQDSEIKSPLSDTNCVGNKYPTTAELMSRGEIVTYDENYDITKMSQSIIEIPLFNIYGNPKIAKKPQVRRTKEGPGILDKSVITFTTLIQFIGTGGAYPLMTLDDKEKKWTGEEPMFYRDKEKSLFKTPMNDFFKKNKTVIKPEDLIDHIELAEDTLYWTINPTNFSSKIPGAKSKTTATGVKYYVDYNTDNLKGQVFLPDDEWWDQYNGFIYKFVNTVKTSGMGTEENKTFGLILQIYGAENFKLNQETNGRSGWSLKVDQSMQMYYSQDNIPVDDLGYNFKDNKISYYGIPGTTLPYNSYSTEMLDSRSSMAAFFQSKISIVISIAAGIAISWVSPILAPLIGEALGIGTTAGRVFTVSAAYEGTTIGSIFTSNMIYQRSIGAVITECLLSGLLIDVPFAFTLFKDGDYLGGTLSAMCMFIPFITELKSFSNWARSVDKSAFKSLGIRLAQLPPFYFEKFNIQRFTEFVNNLSKNEAVAFGQLMDGITSGGKADIKMFQEFYEEIGLQAKKKWEYVISQFRKNKKPLPKIMQESLDQMERSLGVKAGTILKPLIVVGGGAALPQIAWGLYRSLNQKVKKLTKKQLEIITLNLQEWYKNLTEKDLSIQNDIRMAGIKLNIDIELDEWFENFLDTPEGSIIFENLIKINGYEYLLKQNFISLMNSSQTKKIKDSVSPTELISIAMSEEFDNLTLNNLLSDVLNPESVSKLISTLDKNKENVLDQINIIKERFPCVEENQEKFKFIGTFKTEKSGNSWAIFYENVDLTRLSRNIVVFAGYDKKLGVYNSQAVWGWDTSNNGYYTCDGILNYFNSIYPECENFKIEIPENSEYEYKKLKDGKLYKKKKLSDSWVEIKNAEEIKKVTDNYFKV